MKYLKKVFGKQEQSSTMWRKSIDVDYYYVFVIIIKVSFINAKILILRVSSIFVKGLCVFGGWG